MIFDNAGKFIWVYNHNRNITLFIFLSALMLFIPYTFADDAFSARDLTYITEQFPPYNYQEDGKLQGISVDLLEKAWERMDANLNRSVVQLLPWKEGYQETLNTNNTVLFSTARFPQREQLFKWAGPIGPIRNVLLAKKDKNMSIAAPQDLKKYRIGAINDDSAVQMLLDKGMMKEDLVLETASRPIIEMLQNGSIDAWAYGDVAGIWLIRESGANASDFKVAYEFGQTDYYYAFNREVPDSLVQSFQEAIDYMRINRDDNGVSDYERILSNYVPAMQVGNASAPNSAADMLFMLLQIQADVQGSLNDLDMDVSNASLDLSATGLEGAKAHDVLGKILETNSNLVEAVTFGKDGKIIAAECRGCEGDEGADISSQEHITHVLKIKTPTLSKQFLLVEGYNGTALAYPVFSPQGEFLGGISAIIEPDNLLNSVVAPQLHFDIDNRSNITDYSFWLMQLDGLIAYDRDASQIGKNLFEDQLYKPYPSLLALGEKIIAARSGHGYYSFQVTQGNKRVVTKESYWTTTGLHGRQWRLVVTKMT